MKLPKWITVCIVLLAVAAAAQFAAILKLKSDLARAEEKTERLSDKFAEIAFEAGNTKKADRSPDEGALKNLELKVISALRRIDALESGDLGSQSLEEAIDQKLSEKMSSRATENAMLAGLGHIRGAGFRRAPIESVYKSLEMDEDQKSRFSATIKRLREGLLELSDLANNDDPEFVKELNGLVMERGRPRQRNEKVREKLSSRNAPGSDKTYLDALVEMRTGAFSEMEQYLTADQIQKFKDMRTSIFNIGIGQEKEE